MSRTTLTSNTTYYISTTGSDSNDGLTSSTPWLTRQHAWDWVLSNVDTVGYKVTFQMAAGTYTDAFCAYGKLVGQGGQYPEFVGNPSNPWDIIIHTPNNCWEGRDTIYGVDGCTVQSDNSAGVFAEWCGTRIMLHNIYFYGCNVAHMWATKDAWIFLDGPYQIWGSAQRHAYAPRGTIFITGGNAATCTVYSNPYFTVAFAEANDMGAVLSHTMTWSGPVVGKRYNAFWNANIAGQGNPNYYPGSIAGTVDATSVYA